MRWMWMLLRMLTDPHIFHGFVFPGIDLSTAEAATNKPRKFSLPPQAPDCRSTRWTNKSTSRSSRTRSSGWHNAASRCTQRLASKVNDQPSPLHWLFPEGTVQVVAGHAVNGSVISVPRIKPQRRPDDAFASVSRPTLGYIH